MDYDLVIRGGTIVDGSGTPGFRADLAVVDGRIAAIGKIADKGKTEIDASEHAVTPGFIDGHTHHDAQIMWDPSGASSCFHGVTSAVMGNCGFTIAPSRDGERELVLRNLERAEDIPAEAMRQGIEWSFDDFPTYLDTLDRLPKSINYAAQIGHSALRTWAMGERAFDEVASDDDMKTMCNQVSAAFEAGAIGFTTSRGGHETSDDRPVASRIAAWDEVVGLVDTVGQYPDGVFELSLEAAARSADPVIQREFCDRLRDLAVFTKVPVTFGVLPTLSNQDHDWRSLLRLISETSVAGGRIVGQSHCKGVTFVSSFKTQLPFDRLDAWKQVRALPLDQAARELRRPEVRERLVHAAENGPYPEARAAGGEARRPDWDLIDVMLDPIGPNPTVAEVARERGISPAEAMIDLALEADFDRFFVQHMRTLDPTVLLEIMDHRGTVMTFTDAGAHVTQIMDASLQTYLLGHWMRQREVFTLEQAVSMVTMEPARVWKFPERGLLREGLIADINVFDPKTIGPAFPTVETDLPGGAKRLKQKSIGMLCTIVAGQVTIKDGELTGSLPGQLIRRGHVPAAAR